MTARLPIPGQDNGTWGDILNSYLQVSHATDGTLNTGVVGTTQLQNSSVTPSKLSATGTPSATTYLRGDGSWVTPVAGAQVLTPTTVKTVSNSPYSANAGEFVPVDASGGNVIVTLPSAPADKTRLEIKMIDTSGSNTVAINTSGSDVFNKTGGNTSGTLSLLNQALMVQYAASSNIWYVQSDDLPLSQLDTRYARGINVKNYGAVGDGSTNDTAAINLAITALGSAGAGATLCFPPGTYLVDGLTISGLSHFSVVGDGAILKLSSARTGNALVNTHTVLLITDSTDFTIRGLEINGNRHCDITWPTADYAPVTQYLTTNASSGQANLTVQNGSKFVVGERIWVCGGLTANGGTEHDNHDNNGQVGIVINAINGNVLTLASNLGNSYTATGTAGGAYVTTYQTGNQIIIGSRTYGNENAQNGIHLVTCQRFIVTACNIHDIWESPIKCGTGFMTTSLTDGCSYGIISNNTCLRGYDQGISIWLSDHITIVGNIVQDPGWAGSSLTNSWDCSISGNIIDTVYYRIPGDNNSGSGFACEGGGHHTFTGNYISNAWSKGLNLTTSPLFSIGTSPTLGVAINPGTTGSIQVSSSAGFTIGGSYSIIDGTRSEQIIVTAIPDGTHISIGAATTKFWHASGIYLNQTLPEDITFTGNTIKGVLSGTGIQGDACARVLISKNVFRDICHQAINAHSPSSNNGYAAGLIVDGNDFANTNTGGGGEALLFDSFNEVHVTNNLIIGATTSGTIGIHIKSGSDTIIANNRVTDMTNAGIFVENGGGVTKRMSITGNYLARNNNEGIIFLNGDTASIMGNVIESNNATGISVRGVSHFIIKGNVVTSNNGNGIKLEDNGSGCSYCRIEGNTVRNDSSGSYRGSSFTQSNSIVESGSGNNNRIENNIVDVASSKVGVSTTITSDLVG